MTHGTPYSDNGSLAAYIAATEKLRRGEFDLTDLPSSPRDDLARLGDNLKALATALESSAQELHKINQITAHINAGFLLDEILDRIYVEFQDFIPYDRMGVSLIDPVTDTVTAVWARSNSPRQRIRKGYTARLQGSSLQTIIDTGRPRIINDLEQYLREHPESYSTKLALSEGIRSSITCPLVANGRAIGFIFFSSTQPDTYRSAHIDLYLNISSQLSMIVEKGILMSEQASQRAALERQREALEAVRRGLAQIRMEAVHFVGDPDTHDPALQALIHIHRISDELLEQLYRLNAPKR